jgi:hypothetical protein
MAGGVTQSGLKSYLERPVLSPWLVPERVPYAVD